MENETASNYGQWNKIIMAANTDLCNFSVDVYQILVKRKAAAELYLKSDLDHEDKQKIFSLIERYNDIIKQILGL